MKNAKPLLALALGVLMLSSCDDQEKCVNGKGSYASTSYDVNTFDEVSFYGSGDVYIRHDTFTSVRVEAQQNVLDALNIEVRNGDLSIGKDNCFRGSKAIRVYITTPDLSAANLSGSGSMVGTGTFTATNFRAHISGSGSMKFDIDVQNLNYACSGSGEATFSGNAWYQYLEMSGSGETFNFGLLSREANVRLSGSGNCELHVSDKLDVNISGSGNVYYKGNPIIDSKVSGSGRIINRG